MDFAKHELRNAKNSEVVEARNAVYENALKVFEAQTAKVSAEISAALFHQILFSGGRPARRSSIPKGDPPPSRL